MSDKPAVMSDGGTRVLISSIAAYRAVHVNLGGIDNYDVGIEFILKSGTTTTMEFGKRFLRDQAIEWLDEQMGTETIEYKPCDRCANNGKKKSDDPNYVIAYCDTCYPSKAYSEFKPLNDKL